MLSTQFVDGVLPKQLVTEFLPIKSLCEVCDELHELFKVVASGHQQEGLQEMAPVKVRLTLGLLVGVEQ